MRNPALKTLLTLAGVFVGAALLTGCEKENLGNMRESENQSRLIAMENAQLKQDLETQKQLCEQQLRRLHKLHERRMGQQKEALDKCKQQVNSLEELSRDGVQKYMDGVLGPAMDENIKLRQEIEDLKAQIQKLEAELEKLKAKPHLPEGI